MHVVIGLDNQVVSKPVIILILGLKCVSFKMCNTSLVLKRLPIFVVLLNLFHLNRRASC